MVLLVDYSSFSSLFSSQRYGWLKKTVKWIRIVQDAIYIEKEHIVSLFRKYVNILPSPTNNFFLENA